MMSNIKMLDELAMSKNTKNYFEVLKKIRDTGALVDGKTVVNQRGNSETELFLDGILVGYRVFLVESKHKCFGAKCRSGKKLRLPGPIRETKTRIKTELAERILLCD